MKNFELCLLSLCLFAFTACANKSRRNGGTVVDGAEWTKVSQEGKGWASSVVAADDGSLYITDLSAPTTTASVKIVRGTIYRYTPNNNLTRKFIEPSDSAEGLTIDRDGSLLITLSDAGTTRTVLKKDLKTGQQTTLVQSYNGKKFVSPDDIIGDSNGRIYFTDTRHYGDGPSQLPNAVYRIDTNGKLVQIINDLYRPDGIVLSPDEKKLYISTNGSSYLPSNPEGPDFDRFHVLSGAIIVFDIDAAGKATNGKVFFSDNSLTVDGLTVDTEGRIYACLHNGDLAAPLNDIVVIDPTGKVMEHLPLPSGNLATSLSFGKGFDADGLYAAASPWKLYRIATTRRGYFPRTK